MKRIVRSLFASLAIAFAIGAAPAVVLAAVLDEKTPAAASLGHHLDDSYDSRQVASEADVIADYEWQQAFLMPLLLPDAEPDLTEAAGLLPVTDWKGFTKEFVAGLVPIVQDGVEYWPIRVMEDAGANPRRRLILNANDEVIATVPVPDDYEADWWVYDSYPALYDPNATAAAAGYRTLLQSLFDGSRLIVEYNLIDRANLIRLAAKRSADAGLPAASEEPGGGMMMSSWTGGTVANLQFVAIDTTSNGITELTIAWPIDGLSTNMVNFFACTNLMSQDWVIAITTNVDLSTNDLSWVDHVSTNFAVRLYDCWTLDDTDGDGVSDGREKRLYGTDKGEWDTDGDGVGDGAELFTYGTDPINTHNSLLPFSTGFEATSSYSAGTLAGQNGWVSDAGATVQSGMVHAGGQAVEIEGLEATMTKHFATTNDSVTTELFVYLGPQLSVPANLPAAASSLVSFEAGTGIRAFDGNGSGSGSWTTAAGTTSLLNQWVGLKIVQDYSAHTWSLYVDDTLMLSGLGFKDNSVTQLEALHLRSGIGGAVICDDVAVSSN